MDGLLGVVPRGATTWSLFAPFGTQRNVIAAWQLKGWRVVAGLTGVDDDRAEAKRLGCSHVLAGEMAKEI